GPPPVRAAPGAGRTAAGPRRSPPAALSRGAGGGLGRGVAAARRGAGTGRGGADAQTAGRSVPERPAARGLVEVEGRSAHHRCGADLRPVRARAPQHAVHRLHLRAVGGRRPVARRQGVLRPGRQGDPGAGPLDPRPHGRPLRPGARRGTGAGVRAGVRGGEPVGAPQVGRRGPVPADPALAPRQAGSGGRPPGYAAEPGAVTGGARARKREAMQRLGDWFAGRGWRPLRFQKALWRRYLSGESGLLHTPTGSGKTLAAFGGPLLEALAAAPQVEPARAKRRRIPSRPLAVLWVTPLRAL